MIKEVIKLKILSNCIKLSIKTSFEAFELVSFLRYTVTDAPVTWKPQPPQPGEIWGMAGGFGGLCAVTVIGPSRWGINPF